MNSYSTRFGGYTAFLMDEGIVIAVGYPSAMKSTFDPIVFLREDVQDRSLIRLMFASAKEIRGAVPSMDVKLKPVPGMSLAWYPSLAALVAFRHWLIVTFFALFYGVLKCVYRRRGKAVAGEL